MEIAKDDYCKKSLEVENMLLGVKKLDANEKCQGGVKHNQSMILSFYDPVIKHRFIRQYKTPPPSLPPQSDPIITRLLEELSEGLLLAIRTFLRGSKSYIINKTINYKHFDLPSANGIFMSNS
jgi:hypothetical protein